MKTLRKIDLKPHYDLVVIGGGIQGCAMVWEAQSRGLQTLLVERDDFCSQTSANSLKTIHGGIRYLQTMNLSRTWVSSKEQETLMHIAPHLVKPLPWVLPTEKSLKRSPLAVSLGFTLYNLIKHFSCPDKKLPAARFVSKSKLSMHTPYLTHQSVTGAGMWWDAQVQQAERLGLAFVMSAIESGANAFNYLSAESLQSDESSSFQLELSDQLNKKHHQVSADHVVLCAAAATAEVLASFNISHEAMPKFCLAMNIVANKRYCDVAIGLKSGFANEQTTNSKRLLFAAPWRNSTLFGTWYFEGNFVDKSGLKPSKRNVQLCLDDINNTFPDVKLREQDIELVHAGWLPVRGEENHPENDLLEEEVIVQSDNNQNLFVVIPTKYTTCRATAQRTIDQLAQVSSKHITRSASDIKKLVGGRFKSDYMDFLTEIIEQYREYACGSVMTQLVENYGDQVSNIMDMCIENPEYAQLIPGSTRHIRAQLIYELEVGQVQKFSDFVRRCSFSSKVILAEETRTYCEKEISLYHATGSTRSV